MAISDAVAEDSNDDAANKDQFSSLSDLIDGMQSQIDDQNTHDQNDDTTTQQ